MKASEIIIKYATPVVGVGVSGGLDSVSLLYLAVKTLGHDRVIAIHIEHGIRGEESVKDLEFVKELCAKLKVKLISTSANVPQIAKEAKQSVETAARLLRKSVFEDFSKRNGNARVLLAHHADDQKETVLMHLFRGCSIAGLKGMSECDGIYIRPFIGLSRKQIEEFARVNALAYRTDSTNADDSYARNFIRLKVLPLIEERYDTDAILRIASQARVCESFINSFVNDSDFTLEDGAVTFDCASEQEAIKNAYALHAFEKVGLTYDIESKHLSLVSSLKDMENGSMISLPHGFVAIKEYDRIAVYKKREKSDEVEDYEVGLTPFFEGIITVSDTDDEPQKGRQIFDGDKIPADAVIRFRRDGDIFKPFGGGTKKLKEWFVDQRIARRKRDFVPLLCSQSTVLAVIGYEISDDIRVDEKTLVKREIVYEKDMAW